jgi:hypothetical protein
MGIVTDITSSDGWDELKKKGKKHQDELSGNGMVALWCAKSGLGASGVGQWHFNKMALGERW